MNNDKKTVVQICNRLIDKLASMQIKFVIHRFERAAMIDIWVADSFYVVQVEETLIGLSKLDLDDPGFDTIPDEKIFDEKEFNLRLDALIH